MIRLPRPPCPAGPRAKGSIAAHPELIHVLCDPPGNLCPGESSQEEEEHRFQQSNWELGLKTSFATSNLSNLQQIA